MATAEPVQGVTRECACGLERTERGGGQYLVCRNCDLSQPNELIEGGSRVRTKEDHMFDLVMSRRMKSWYSNT
jgi:hypothetical protein